VTTGCTRGWVGYLLDVNSRAKSLDRLSCNALSHEKSVLVTGSFLRSSCNPTSSSSSSCTCQICLVSILQAQDSTQPNCRLIQMSILQGTNLHVYCSTLSKQSLWRDCTSSNFCLSALRFQSRLYRWIALQMVSLWFALARCYRRYHTPRLCRNFHVTSGVLLLSCEQKKAYLECPV
jgi:hypothetical protein